MAGLPLTSIEICAGAGGQALGLEKAGFGHVALVEIDPHACRTLRKNRPEWNVIEGDVRAFHAHDYQGVDLLAGGVPCPPFSVAGKQLGKDDERDLFPEMIRLASECRPRAIMIENVRGLLDPKFASYRAHIRQEIEALGYESDWRLVQAAEYGVPQLRPRTIFVALLKELFGGYSWPEPRPWEAPTVGEALRAEMGSRGWPGASEWAARARSIAPTIVGGSKKHGGPDLGPSRARLAWAALGVNGNTVAEEAPGPEHQGPPRLTVRMASIVQGFPPEWEFVGTKTAAYRQVGNAFPPPVAAAVGSAIAQALTGTTTPGKRKTIAHQDLLFPA
ncbi:MAG TPA: DNA cytosine methyltransferase [Deinococcales bacterium]|nr:DNA cytosine methyltransferase [Deinococcales bacterium]